MGVRVTRILVLLNNISVEKNPRKLLKIAAVGGRLVETLNQAAILAVLHGFNIEKNLRMLAKVAAVENGLIEETVAQVTVTFNNINVEEKPQKLVKNLIFNNELDVELKKGEWKNDGTSDGNFGDFAWF